MTLNDLSDIQGFFVADLLEITLAHKRGHCHMQLKSTKQTKQLYAYSVLIAIYSGIARFQCDSTALSAGISDSLQAPMLTSRRGKTRIGDALPTTTCERTACCRSDSDIS